MHWKHSSRSFFHYIIVFNKNIFAKLSELKCKYTWSILIHNFSVSNPFKIFAKIMISIYFSGPPHRTNLLDRTLDWLTEPQEKALLQELTLTSCYIPQIKVIPNLRKIIKDVSLTIMWAIRSNIKYPYKRKWDFDEFPHCSDGVEAIKISLFSCLYILPINS